MSCLRPRSGSRAQTSPSPISLYTVQNGRAPCSLKPTPCSSAPVGHSSGSDSSSAGEATRGTVLPALPSMFGGPVASGKNWVLGIWWHLRPAKSQQTACFFRFWSYFRCMCVRVCACVHTHAHTTPHSLHCNTVRRQLSKESLPGSVNLPYCGSSCPTPIYQVSALQGIHAGLAFSLHVVAFEKGCPTHLSPNPREPGAQPCLLWDVGGTPHVPFRLGRQSGSSPPADLCFLFCRWVVCLSPLSPESPKIISRVKTKKENSRKVPSSSSHGPESTSWLGCE